MRILVVLMIILCAACRKDKDPAPGKALLLLPANSEVCAEGKVISATQSVVLFSWQAAANADTYTITIKNLQSSALITETTDKTKLEVTLDRNSPYSWSVKASRAGKEMSSDIWKFYNPGPALTSYSPFPADLVAPRYAEAVGAATAILKWSCADADNDIESYDVYLGTANTPPVFKAGVKETSLSDLLLEGNKTYYWKIVAIDKKGNKSTSDTYTFKTN